MGFILVSAGCAVGLGNVWKFPYICGQNGGAAFILIYLVFLAILGLPILISEFAVGRGSRLGASKAYEKLEPAGTKWHHFKWFSIFGNYLLMMFYTMVGGWMLFYIYRSASGKLTTMSADEVGAAFSDMLASPGTMVGVDDSGGFDCFWNLCTWLAGRYGKNHESHDEYSDRVDCHSGDSFSGVAKRHGRCKILSGAESGCIKSRGLGAVVFDAMTHSFFTLSVGIGAMEIFGSYQKREHSIPGEAKNIVILDTFVALMAGFIIIPACFAYGVQPDAGPSLLFITLPNVFNNMAGGRVWGTCFFIFMSFAALSTIIAVFENIISFYMDMGGWSRKKAVVFNIVLIIALSLPAVLGFNLLSGFQPMGAGTSVMDLEDFLVSYNLLPLGSMILSCSV